MLKWHKVFVAVAVATLFVALPANSHDANDPRFIEVYTHGDTQLARFGANGEVMGQAHTLLECAAADLGFSYEFKFAPLSRAASLRQTHDHMMWFPSANDGSPYQQARAIGPIGDIDIIWYQLKEKSHDTASQAFFQNAKVTAYTGSAFAQVLQDQGYNFVSGSADHKRLIYLLLTGSVDAVLAVDFRFKLPRHLRAKVDQLVHTSVYSKTPIYFNLSDHMVSHHPRMVKSLRAAIKNCRR